MHRDDQLTTAAEVLLQVCRGKGLKLATAESCTGGLIAGTLTAVAGSSDVVETVGAVSEEVARAMAEGALKHSRADLAVSVTGIAGPGGATETKPVGLVHLAVARDGFETIHAGQVFDGDRAAVRRASVIAALDMLMQAAKR